MITHLDIPSQTIATSSGSEPTLVLVTCSLSEPPNDLNRTSINSLFIALHIILVRIRPAAPTMEPAIIKTLFPIINPVNAAAMPDNEFSKLTTTGISAPPIGSTNKIPRIDERAIIAIT